MKGGRGVREGGRKGEMEGGKVYIGGIGGNEGGRER